MIRQLINKIYNIIEDINTSPYQVKDNWHKHPIISKLCCELGRHDFEYEATIFKGNKPVGSILSCFYCERKRKSYRG